jgi:transposase InsO family protein
MASRSLCAAQRRRSWYYTRTGISMQAERDVVLRDAINRPVLESPDYGYRRVTKTLQHDGWTVNHKRVLRVMRHEMLLCQPKSVLQNPLGMPCEAVAERQRVGALASWLAIDPTHNGVKLRSGTDIDSSSDEREGSWPILGSMSACTL